MLVRTLIQRIEAVAPLQGACAWDKSGVQLAARRDSVRRLAVMLDPLPGQIARALDWEAEFILCHHPLVMQPRFLDVLSPVHEVTRLVLGRDAWLYAAHTSLDARPDGPAGWLPRELGLTKCLPIEITADASVMARLGLEGPAGVGVVGDLPAPLPFDALLKRLQALLPEAPCRLCGPRTETVRRVGLCAGSGASLAEQAFALGADVFITGDVKYHAALETSGPLLDLGHFSIEEEMMRRFATQLAELCPGVQLRFFPGLDPFVTLAPGRTR